MSNNTYMLVQVSVETSQQAQEIASAVVERKLVACAQIMPISSCYEWQGAIARDDEFLLLLKTRADAYTELETCIHELHTYEVPEIVALPIVQGSASYLRWIDDVVGSR